MVSGPDCNSQTISIIIHTYIYIGNYKVISHNPTITREPVTDGNLIGAIFRSLHHEKIPGVREMWKQAPLVPMAGVDLHKNLPMPFPMPTSFASKSMLCPWKSMKCPWKLPLWPWIPMKSTGVAAHSEVALSWNLSRGAQRPTGERWPKINQILGNKTWNIRVWYD